jgi:ATP-dependent Clp protease ATP-binding subunit ClpB
MRLDKLTSKFQLAIADAQSLALGRDHQYIEATHLMLALLNQDSGSIRPILADLEVDINRLRSQLSAELDHIPKVEGIGGDVQISAALGSLLNLCDKYAQKSKDKFISSELFLLAACEDKGALGEIFKQLGLSKEKVAASIEKIRGGQKVDDQNEDGQIQALAKFTIDLTERAEQGKLDPVICRDDEVRRMVQVLQRRTKNNPVIIGEPVSVKPRLLRGLHNELSMVKYRRD